MCKLILKRERQKEKIIEYLMLKYDVSGGLVIKSWLQEEFPGTIRVPNDQKVPLSKMELLQLRYLFLI